MSNLSFTQGFLLGQASVVIFIAFFIKFFIFGESPSVADVRAQKFRQRSFSSPHQRAISINSPTSSPQRRLKQTIPQQQRQQQQQQQQRAANRNVLRPPTKLTTATILDKTYYNVKSHQPESLDWFNVLIAQTIAQFRDDAHQDEAILSSLTALLNGEKKPDYLGEINVTEISLGEDFPILSNCRVHPVAEEGGEGRLQARMDVDLSDFITLGIETRMLLNYPKPVTAVLPVALAVSIVRLSGTLCVSFLPSAATPTATLDPQSPVTSTHSPTSLSFSLLPDYRLDLSVRSLVGSRSRLQDVPKIAQLVETGLHAWIDERVVQPRVQQVVLPSLWPRKKNTREPSHSNPAGPQQQRQPDEAQEMGGWDGDRDFGILSGGNLDDENHGHRESRFGQDHKENEGMEHEGIRWRSGGATAGKSEMPGGLPGVGVI